MKMLISISQLSIHMGWFQSLQCLIELHRLSTSLSSCQNALWIFGSSWCAKMCVHKKQPIFPTWWCQLKKAKVAGWPQGGIASQDASGYPATKLGLSTSTFPFCEVSCWWPQMCTWKKYHSCRICTSSMRWSQFSSQKWLVKVLTFIEPG
jgi:hypothetical protein